MLYKIKKTGETLQTIEPLPFLDFSALGKLEKDLENILAEHLLETLFEDAVLMPIFQERLLQSEGDLYALNKDGDLFIFELKRGVAGTRAMEQALRYSQTAGQWSYKTLEDKYNTYMGTVNENRQFLSDAHREAFLLDHALPPVQFNQKQHLYVIGNAANDDLINAVNYWKKSGLSVDFLPYRLYELAGEYYFEFFALPYDRHINPSNIKGVLFDTNRSYDQEAIWEMMEQKRVAAYGGVSHVVEYLNPHDIVFFSHKWTGIVAAAEVTGAVKNIPENDEQYRDVRFLTPVPEKENDPIVAMPFSEVSKITGRSFFWARTIKVPYLNRDEAMNLVKELNDYLKTRTHYE